MNESIDQERYRADCWHERSQELEEERDQAIQERDEARAECERLNRQINNEVAASIGIIEKQKELDAACAAMREALGKIYACRERYDTEDALRFSVNVSGYALNERDTGAALLKRLEAAEYICRWIETQGIRIYSETELDVALKAWQKERDENV